MSISVPDFWKLAVRSQVISLDEARSLHATFSRTPGAARANSVTVAEWLISNSVLSRFQARQLLAGQAGPFVLGDYKVFDQIATGPLSGLQRAIHAGSGQTVLLFFCDADQNTPADWAAAQQQAQAVVAARYPHAGRNLGMVEAAGRRFLVLEDNSDQLPAAVAVSPRQPQPVSQTLPRQAAAQPIAARPQPASAATPRAPSFMPIPDDDFMSIPDSPVSFARKKQSDHNSLIVFGGVGVAGLALLALLLAVGGESEKPAPSPGPLADATQSAGTTSGTSGVTPSQPAPASGNSPDAAPSTAVPPTAGASQPPVKTDNKSDDPAPVRQVVLPIADDGHTLWISPTKGQPIDLRYLAPGGQMFLVVRPAEILGSSEGEKVFQALGPRGEHARAWIAATTGIEELHEIERLLVAFYPVDAAPPQVSLVVTLRTARPREELLEAWHNPKAAGKDKSYYQGTSWAYYFPQEGSVQTFVVAPPALMPEVVEQTGPPVMRKEMEKLLRDTDDSRQLTLLLAPNFLFSEGKLLLSGDLAKLKEPLLAYFGDGVLAASISFQLEADNFFAEMRAYSALDTSPYELAELYRNRLSKLPDAIETYLAQLNPQPYGRFILTRMPRMIGQLAAHTRIADENRHAVLRCYLPIHAAHNLTLATELALSEQPGGGPIAVAGSAPDAPPATLEEALKRPVSLGFPRNTLEKCLEMLADEIGYPIHIEGADLQLEGITKNQSFGLDERNKPAEEILRKVMLLANPDGKLVYVLRPVEPGGKNVVFVTTRAAVAKRGDKLPPELAQPPAPK